MKTGSKVQRTETGGGKDKGGSSIPKRLDLQVLVPIIL